MDKFCTNCGGPLKDSAKFCPSCGRQIISTPNIQNQAARSKGKKVKPPKKKRRFSFIRILALILIIAISAYFANDYFFSNPYISSDQEASLNMTELIASSPFYYYDNGMKGDKADLIKKYILGRAKDSLDAAEMLSTMHTEALPQFQELFDMTQEIRQNHIIDDDLYHMIIAYETLMTMSLVAKADYESQDATGSDHSYVNAQMTSQKLYYMAESTTYMVQAFELMATYAAMMVEENGLTSDNINKTALANMDEAFASTDLLNHLFEMLAYVQVIEDNIQLVNIAKMEVAQESMTQAWEQAPELTDHLVELEQMNHPLMTRQMVDDIHVMANAAVYNLIIAQAYLDMQMQDIDTSGISMAAIDPPFTIFPKAYAAQSSVLDQKVDVDETIRKAQKADKSWWGTAKRIGKAFVDTTQYVAGSVIEITNANFGAFVRTGVYLYDGLVKGYPITTEFINNDFKEHYNECGQRIWEGKGGSAIFAKGLELADQTTDFLIEQGKPLGEEFGVYSLKAYSKLTGVQFNAISEREAKSIGNRLGAFAGNMAAGFLTDVAKGTYKTLDPASTDEEFTSGLFDITKGLIRSYLNVSNSFATNMAAKGSVVALTTAAQDISLDNRESETNRHFKNIRKNLNDLLNKPANSLTLSKELDLFEKTAHDTTLANLEKIRMENISSSDAIAVKTSLVESFELKALRLNVAYDYVQHYIKQAFNVPVPSIEALVPSDEVPDQSDQISDALTEQIDPQSEDSSVEQPEDTSVENSENTSVDEVPTMNGDYVDLGTFLNNYFSLLSQLTGTSIPDLTHGQTIEAMTVDRQTSLEIGATSKETLLIAYINYAYGLDPGNYLNRAYEDVLESYFGPLPSEAFTNPEAYTKTLDQGMFGN